LRRQVHDHIRHGLLRHRSTHPSCGGNTEESRSAVGPHSLRRSSQSEPPVNKLHLRSSEVLDTGGTPARVEVSLRVPHTIVTSDAQERVDNWSIRASPTFTSTSRSRR